jgi:hypothetical protein
MKYLKYLTIVLGSLTMVAFIPLKKQRKIKPVAKAPFGHVQSIREVHYHATEDSSGNITKGDIISDTDYSRIKSNRESDMLQRHTAEPPIILCIYDEYGDEVRNEKCHANGKFAGTSTHIYYETGDTKEIIDSIPGDLIPITNIHIQQYRNKYDAWDNLLVSDKWDYYAANKNNPAFSRTVNFYDSSGKVKEAMTFNSDTVNPTIIIWSTYNEKGKLVETDERRRNGNTPGVAAYEKNDYWYDKKGRLYDKATYRAKEGLIKDEKITFDSTGKTIITYSYTTNKKLTGTVEKRVFTATNTTQEDTYDEDGLLTKYTISHDSAKHLMDKGEFQITYKSYMGADRRYHNTGPGDTVMVHHIVNDNHFNTIIDDNFSTNGKSISQKTFQYSYDNMGNWIAKIQFNNNVAVKIIEREIVYFND